MPETSVTDSSLSSAIEQAIVTTPKEFESENAEAQETETNRETPKEGEEGKESGTGGTPGTEGDETDEFGLSAADQKEAKQLLAGLKDPNKRGIIIQALAQHAGIINAPETKKEAVEQAESLVEAMKKALGPELEYLAEKMGPVIEKQFKKMVEGSQADIRQTLDQAATERLVEQANAAQGEIGKEFFGEGKEIPKALVQETARVMDRIPAAQGQKMKDYILDCMYVAAGKLGMQLQKIDPSQKSRVDRNRTDAPSRLASEGSRQPRPGETQNQDKGKKLSLQESIESALEETKKKLD